MNIGKKGDYQIRIQTPLDLKPYWQDVEGYKVVIEGFEEFDFFTHKRDNTLLDKVLWRISEVSTGYALPAECDGATRLRALEKATEYLKSKGKKDRLLEVIKLAKEYRGK